MALCITTASVSVLVNGSPTKKFSIKKGLRQGCPLSPFLFNLVGEALSGLIGNVYHIFSDWLRIWDEDLGCQWGSLPSTYLGLPLGHNRNSITPWKPIVDNFSARLDSWKSSVLSFGGRLTLVKSVLSSMLVYYLSLFQMSVAVANTLNKMIASFIWGASSGRAIHWVQDSLRRRVVVAKYDLEHDALLPGLAVSRSMSWIWRQISDPVMNEENVFSKISGAVLEMEISLTFGRTIGRNWNIVIRRALFQWELNIWDEFMNTINRASHGDAHWDSLRRLCGGLLGAGSRLAWNLPRGAFLVLTLSYVYSVKQRPRQLIIFFAIARLYGVHGLSGSRVGTLIWKSWTSDQNFYSAVFRIARWCKCKWSGSRFALVDFLNLPSSVFAIRSWSRRGRGVT
ncbi:hypothetical protein F3Y22_tig00111392pilonHSYRG00065 [Hibiscus syriacus]|uniref:Uncharacterized protein n=1 Tax=Hibiscus syriacus TaxID=106335 RepID=A0A6A2YLJ3_HIBSY|nr:hypothetical protein F3Y22_tig00111392pilonHSYRG00065 [Hibiscus syriacus]